MSVELRAWGVAWALVAVRDVAGLVEPGLEQAGATQQIASGISCRARSKRKRVIVTIVRRPSCVCPIHLRVVLAKTAKRDPGPTRACRGAETAYARSAVI